MNGVSIGREVGRLRREAGLTQAALAERIGTTQSAVSRLESGRVVPSLPLLAKVARATGRPIRLVIEPSDSLPGRVQRRRRVRRALGDYVFNPWDRKPTAAEAKTLEADRLSRDRFEGTRSAGSRSAGA
ncbi:MAG TPA: helix-turn-helix transcriptional regulator [Actinomycetota bacterium]